MALAAGTRLGVFEILSPLGKGGVGSILRANLAAQCPQEPSRETAE